MYCEFSSKTLEKGDLAVLGTKRKDDFEPFWQDEKDWLCIVEFLPTDNPEARLFAAEIIGYPIYLRFSIQPINVPAATPTANVVATVSTRCRWRR